MAGMLGIVGVSPPSEVSLREVTDGGEVLPNFHGGGRDFFGGAQPASGFPGFRFGIALVVNEGFCIPMCSP